MEVAPIELLNQVKSNPCDIKGFQGYEVITYLKNSATD